MTEPGARVRQKFDELDPGTQSLLLRGGANNTPGRPADIAAAVAFLVSDEAAQINGVLLTVGG